MAIGITGANNGYSRTAADNRFFSLTGGTINGNLIVTGTLSASQYLGITQGGGGVSGDYLPLSGGTVNGNLTITGTLCTTLLEALSANITVLDIKQYELSGFNVQGNATVQGTVSANNTIYGNRLAVPADGLIFFGTDTILSRGISANLQLGGPDAAVPISQTLSVQSRVSGFGNRSGTPFAIAGSRGTGSADGGSIIFQTAPAGSSGTALNPLSAALTITSAGNVGIGTTTPTAKLDIADTTLAGSGGLSGSALNISQTWATSGSPTAIKLNVTNTNSGADSQLIDLKVNNASKFYVNKDGVAYASASYVVLNTGGAGVLQIANNASYGYHMAKDYCVTWGSNATLNGSIDVSLSRDDPGILAQRNGTSAQESRIYGTYTGTTNFERLALKYNGSVYQIGTEKGVDGGVAKPLQFYTDSIVRMVLPTTGLITVRDETGTQQQLINNYTYLNNSFSDGGPTAAQWLLDASTNNILHNYGNRLTVTNTGTTAASGVFTQLIEWPLSELTDVNGMVYAEGFVILRFYSGGNAQSVRCRVWNNVASAWSSYSAAVDITKLTSFGLWRAGVGGNYMTKLEVETTSPPGNAVNLQAVEYYPTRNNNGIRYPHYFAGQGADKLLFGGGKSTHASIVRSGNILKVRNGNDSADGSITAAAGTFSTTLSVAGVSTFSSIKTTGIDLIRSDGNLMPGALATSNVGGVFVTIGNSGNSNGTLIYGNSTNGIGINVGATVALIKPTVLGQSNGTTNTTNLAIYNTQAGQTQVGLKFGNMSTSANSNIAINFGDYTDAAYSQIRGIYNGAVQTGQIAFLTANGGALAESLRITNTGNVGIGTTTPNARLTVVGNISAAGDIAVATSLQGVILVSPNSTRWKITVNDDGSLQTTAL